MGLLLVLVVLFLPKNYRVDHEGIGKGSNPREFYRWPDIVDLRVRYSTVFVPYIEVQPLQGS